MRLYPLLVVLVLLAALGTGVAGAEHTGRGAVGAGVTINGPWVITGLVNESNVAISVTGGGVTIQAGGTLDLWNVNLVIAEPSDLAYGLTIQSKGTLNASGLDFTSSTSVYHTWMKAQSGSSLSLRGGQLDYVGGPSGSTPGLSLQNSNARLNGVTFANYYEAIQVASAPHAWLSGLTFLNSTSTSNQAVAVNVLGGSPGFVLTDSRFMIPQDVYALRVASNGARITNNVFQVDPNGSQSSAVNFDFLSGGSVNADYSIFENNSLTGTGFIDDMASYVTISGNRIVDTGPAREFGILAEVPLNTNPGMWVTHLTVENNYVSDYTRYGIRLQQNVSSFVVRGNTLVHPSPTPGPPRTERWGGPEIDGLYLIRGVEDGTVDHNVIDMTDSPGIATNGLTLESMVENVRVSYNTFYNITQVGVDVQGNMPGWDSAMWYQRAPSLYNYINNNLFENLRYVQQTNFSFNGAILWNWANHTTFVNNTFIGYQNTNTWSTYNGAIFLTDASYGVFANNTIEGARYGFVFHKFAANSTAWSGEFNRSYNLVYGNHLSGITVAPVAETPTDGMGPLHNVIDVLTGTSVPPGVPANFTETIAGATSIGASEKNGAFSEVLGTLNPITGAPQTFVTTVPWTAPSFEVEVTGGLGGGAPFLSVSQVNSSSVTYRVPAFATQTETVGFHPTALPYWGLYGVKVTVGTSQTKMRVNSSAGAASFLVNGGGEATVAVSLLSWGLLPSNGTNSSLGIVGSVLLANGTSPAYLTVTVGLSLPNGQTTTVGAETATNGAFQFAGLTAGSQLLSVGLSPAGYVISHFALNSSNPTLWHLTIFGSWASGGTGNNSTSPGGNSTGPGGGSPPGGTPPPGAKTTPPVSGAGSYLGESSSTWLALLGIVVVVVALGGTSGAAVGAARRAARVRRLRRR